jgi:hypothetical protein
MMQVPGAFAAQWYAYFLPPSGGHPVDGRAFEALCCTDQQPGAVTPRSDIYVRRK